MIDSAAKAPNACAEIVIEEQTNTARRASSSPSARVRTNRTVSLCVGLAVLAALVGCVTGEPSGPAPAATAPEVPASSSRPAAPAPEPASDPTARAPRAAPILGDEAASPGESDSDRRATEVETSEPSDRGGASAPDATAASADGEKESEQERTDDAEADPNATTEKEQPEEEAPRRIVLKTVYDDRRVGDDQSEIVEAELGLVEDEELERYVRSVAVRLLRHAPNRPFEYEFRIVDQNVPNAFALPGGKIYVSRGLLALVDSEDELAGVLGHEITHAAERHAAGRIEHAARLNPFAIGLVRAAAIAAYGRDQERDADRGGQILAAKAGYNPLGIATFLRKLDAADRYVIGWSQLPYFLATHPTSPERSALAANRAASLEWTPAPAVAADQPFGYFSMIDGLILGENPAGGVFEETLFVHPDLRFSIRFPRGWSTMNSPQMVSAISPARDAQATLSVEGEAGDLEKAVDRFIEKDLEGTRLQVQDRRAIQIGDLPAIRVEGRASGGGIPLWTQMTFLEHGGLVYRLSMVSVRGVANVYRGRASAFARSFRVLDETAAHSLEVNRLRLARALENETLQQLSARTGNSLELVYTGVLNDLFASTPLARGTVVKIGLREPYIPAPREDPQRRNEPGDDEKGVEMGEPTLEPEP
jgi:predicted Zn-dependent protease